MKPQWVGLCNYDGRRNRSYFHLDRLWIHGEVWKRKGQWYWELQISGDQDEELGSGEATSEEEAKKLAVQCAVNILKAALGELGER